MTQSFVTALDPSGQSSPNENKAITICRAFYDIKKNSKAFRHFRRRPIWIWRQTVESEGGEKEREREREGKREGWREREREVWRERERKRGR